MLAVSPFRSGSNNDDQIIDHGDIENFSMLDELSNDALLDDINFDDLFVEFGEGEVLPDLEAGPSEIFAEFSEDKEDSGATSTAVRETTMVVSEEEEMKKKEEKELSCHGEEVVSEMRKDSPSTENSKASESSETNRSRKSSKMDKGSLGKRKVKVDWTPELHRRFVQAVEQLGVDKAVPSRILEIMGIDCLTRHNIASHLQKYRSHRKHLLAREAEAASLSHRRQMYAAAGAAGTRVKPDMNSWLAPTIGFPPRPPPHALHMVQTFRPLHVWGHPTSTDPPMVPMWPRHIAPRSVGPPWGPPLPAPPDPSYWHGHYPRVMSPGTPCFPQPLPSARFPGAAVPGILPHPTMYRPVPPPMSKQSSSQLQLDFHPSKERIDAAIGDVLDKPWLPLPLGLKPPSIDSVLGELQKQGISKVPPSTS